MEPIINVGAFTNITNYADNETLQSWLQPLEGNRKRQEFALGLVSCRF